MACPEKHIEQSNNLSSTFLCDLPENWQTCIDLLRVNTDKMANLDV